MNLTFVEESSPHFDGQLWKTFDETGKRRKEAVIAAPTGCGRIQNVGGGAHDVPFFFVRNGEVGRRGRRPLRWIIGKL